MNAPAKPMADMPAIYFPSRATRLLMQNPCPELPLARAHSPSCANSPNTGGGKPNTSSSSEAIGQRELAATQPAAPSILPGTGPGGSIEAVLMARMQQLARGYTPELDEGKTVFEFLQLIRILTTDVERAWPIAKSQRDPDELERALAELGATVLAAMDRLKKEKTENA